jgi:hypothetical protein
MRQIGKKKKKKKNCEKKKKKKNYIPPRGATDGGGMPAELCTKRRSAGLFLDSPRLNGHTTASDMALAGVPVLTMRGSSAMTSRVASSFAAEAAKSDGAGSAAAGPRSETGTHSHRRHAQSTVVGSMAEYVAAAIAIGRAAPGSVDAMRAAADAAAPRLFNHDAWMRAWERAIESTIETRCAGRVHHVAI